MTTRWNGPAAFLHVDSSILSTRLAVDLESLKFYFFNEFKSLLFWRGIKLIETHEKLTYVVTSKSKATGRAAIPCSLAVNDAQPNITLDAQ